jgi:hypothetical protein
VPQRECSSLNRQGMPCRAPAMKTGDQCWSHAHPQESREAAKRGGLIAGGMRRKEALVRRINRMKPGVSHRDVAEAVAEGLQHEDIRIRLLAAALLVRTLPRYARPTLAGITAAMTGERTEATLKDALRPGLEAWRSLPRSHPLRQLYPDSVTPRVLVPSRRERELERDAARGQ